METLKELVEYLLGQLRTGRALVVYSGYEHLGLEPHSLRPEQFVKDADHIGYGCFTGSIAGRKCSFSAGGAAERWLLDTTYVSWSWVIMDDGGPVDGYPYSEVIRLLEERNASINS